MGTPLFITPEPVLEKVAGYRLPREASLWQPEVIQHLASQHPYLPLDRVEVNFKKIDARKGAAIGAVIVDDKIAIPLIIQRPSPGKDPELKPLDVFYYEGRYRYLDPDNVRSVIMRPEIGRPAPRRSGGAYPGRNDHYIGDLTGDRSPLEHAYFGGSNAKLASASIEDLVNFPSSSEVGGGTEKIAKEREAKVSPATRSAASFGVTGAVGGGLRGAARELIPALKGPAKAAETPGTAKQKAVRALTAAARDAAFFGTTGAVAGGTSSKVLDAMGMSRSKLTPEERKQVSQLAGRVADREIQKTEKKAFWRPPNNIPPHSTHAATTSVDKMKGPEGVILADAVNPSSEPAARRNAGDSREHAKLRLEGRKLLTVLREEGALDPNDLANFRQLIAHQPEILLAARNNLEELQGALSAAPEKGTVPRHPIAGPRVMQIFKTRDGLKIKFAGRSPESASKDTLRQLLGSKFQDAMQKVDDGLVFVLTDEINPTSWSVDRTPRASVPVDRDGLWLLRAPQGEAVPAFVAKSVMKLDGTVLPVRCAITRDGRYAMGREMFGARVSDKNRLPAIPLPKSGDSGFFVHYIQGSPTVTVPVKVTSVTTLTDEKGHERKIFKVTDTMTGEKCAIIPDKDIYGIARITWPEPSTRAAIGPDIQAYAIPASSEFIPTNGTFKVAEQGEFVTKVAGVENVISLSEKDGLFSVEGQFNKEAVFGLLKDVAAKGVKQMGSIIKNPGKHLKGVEKAYEVGRKRGGSGLANVAKAYAPTLQTAGMAGGVGLAGYGAYKGLSGKQASFDDVVEIEWTNADKHSVIEVLAAAGMTGDDAQKVIKVAQERGLNDPPVVIKGLQAPIVVTDEDEFSKFANAEEEFEQEYIDAVMALRPDVKFLKSAAESQNPETIDAVLSLEFITPQNARYFYESVDQLEEVASKLAALLVSVRIGIQHVPEGAVRDALEGISKTITSLKVLKSASEGSRSRVA